MITNLGPLGLESAVDDSVKSMDWLTGADDAAVKLAKTYAERMDKGALEFEGGLISSTEYNKVLYLGPHLLNTLRALGGTPDARSSKDSGPSNGRILDELKAKRSKKAAGGR
ncbi:hypothetical protein ODZ83_05530 [Acaricomes phytoseiuli]|uniref:terminase small subunit n=1 Tax=Acaricomes phytoseiuli TaxID=291968 RepID=UPI002223C4BD|nr:hypothetical protein [Acaricomes phytoseiuli]MCW1249652.1 hypothetical protein [Acaricomes phytoseiuli]